MDEARGALDQELFGSGSKLMACAEVRRVDATDDDKPECPGDDEKETKPEINSSTLAYRNASRRSSPRPANMAIVRWALPASTIEPVVTRSSKTQVRSIHRVHNSERPIALR